MELLTLLLVPLVWWLARRTKRVERQLADLTRTTGAAWKAIEQLARERGLELPPREVAEPPPARPSRPPVAVSGVGAGPVPARPEDGGAGWGHAPPPPRATPAPPPKKSAVPLEQLLGVRGAALLAGIAMIAAAFFFLKIAIDRGYLTPELRVVLGLAAGIGALVGSEVLARRKLSAAAGSLGGAGAAILYAVSWAAFRRYQLIGLPVAFTFMVLTTAVAGLLSVRRASLVIAVMGLLGGFATPLVLSTGEDRPIGLFAYVLLLDLGVVWVALRQRWHQLASLGVLATVAIEALWLFARFTPERFLLALGIFAAFGVLFASLGLRIPSGERRSWLFAQALGALAPFVFGAYLAQHYLLGAPIVPLAAFVALLGVAAHVLARAHQERFLAVLGTGGVLTVLAVWSIERVRVSPSALADHGIDPATLVGPSSLGMLAVTWIALGWAHHALVEWEARRPLAKPIALLSVPILECGLLVLTVAWLWRDEAAGSLAIPAVAWALGAALLREARLADRSWIGILGACAVALALVARSVEALDGHSEWREVGLLVGTAVAAQLAALAGRRGATWLAGEWAALILAVAFTGLIAAFAGFGPLRDDPALALGAPLVLGVLGLLAAARTGRGTWMAATLAAAAIAHASWQSASHGEIAPWTGLPFYAAAVAIFCAWPFIGGRGLGESRAAWRVAAVAPLAWLPIAREAWIDAWGDGAIGLLPVLLACASVAAAWRARVLLAADEPRRRWALAWFAAVALGLVSIAIPMQLDREWITIGWAIEGLALVILFERLDQPGLKYVAMAFFATVAIRLCSNPAVLEYHERSGLPVLNWLLYTYVIPAAAMVEGARRLARIEVERLRPRELTLLYRKPRPWLAGALGLGAVVTIFVWINLTIADAFGTGSELTLDFDRAAQARNLTLSVAWALYAVVLLVIGVARKIVPLRWVALLVLFVAIVKVFLWDLGNLGGLYRVVSLLGLAGGLIGVSLLYQRFVYRSEEAP